MIDARKGTEQRARNGGGEGGANDCDQRDVHPQTDSDMGESQVPVKSPSED